MPRRKQGQSKETTGGEIKKKTDSSRETNQYDPTEQASAQKELVSQVAELSSTPAAGSFRNGSTDGSSPVIVSNRSDDDSMKSVNGKTINIQICDVLSRNCFLPQNDGVIKTSDKALNGIESIETSEGRIAINGNKVSPEKVIVNHMPVNQNVSCLNKILFNTDVTDPAVTTSVHCDGQDLRAKKKFKVATRDEKSDCGAVVSQNTVTEQPYYLHKVLHQHVEGSLNPVIHNENDRNDHNLEVSTVQMGIVSDDCAINGVTKNKVVYNDCGENSGEMSGLSPALIRNTHQGNLSDSHQLNYRISSSVIETKASMSSDILSLLPNKESNLILEDQGFQLPSSVYGTSSSSIETVLTGLCLFSGQEIKCIPNSLSSPENENSSQKFEDSLCVSVNDDDGMKNNSGISSSKEDFQKAEQSSLDSKLKSWDPKNDTKDREKNSASILSNQNLKLFIPNRAQAINQSSPQQQLTESSKNIKFPQITSPQILEQHISKIISENAAIVETLDPLWSRRYLRQSSVSSNNGDFKKINNGPQTRSLSEEKQTNLVSSENICHSKLQTALLGGLHADNRGPLPVTPSTASAFSCKSVPLEMSPFLQCNSSASLPTGNFFSKIGSSTVSEEELQGSAIKSLLSLKQGKFSCHKNSVYFSKEVSQKHPQNPEGSIIKDLLLKNKSKVESKATASSDEEDISSTNVGKGTSNTEDAPDGTLYLFHCTGCKDQFKTKDDVDGHVAHCKAISDIKNTVEDYSESCPSLLNRCSSFVSFSEEKLVKNFSKLLNLPASSSDEQNFVSKGVKLFDSSDEDATGHLLKKQLLSPLSRRKTLTSKKRKISEPVISMNRQDNALIYQIPETYLNAKVVFSQPLEDISASAHRCRSQSVHLFGGEVQILDGIQTKKMKISTNLQSVFSSPQNMFSNGSPFKKSMSGVLEKFKDNPITMPTVVVTIAQPVHNSGGTVTHLPTLTPPPSISPVVTLSNHLMPAGVEKFSDLSLPLSKSLLNSTSFDSPTFQTLTGHPIRRCEADIVGQSRNQCDILSSFSGCTLSPSSSKSAVSFGDMNSPLHLNFPAVSVETPLSSSNFIFKGRNSFFNENSFDFLKSTAPPKPFAPVNSQQQSFSEHIHNLSTNTKPCKVEETIALDFQSSKSYVIPMVTFTPSSPTHPSSFDKEESGENTDGEKVSNKKFLAPTRPTSLPLKKKPFTMVGSTLISPETPRPKKSCVQLYLNGHAYTYLGLKCSTRSTYCCIYRPQPMYVLQDTNPKLSMYSNWQVVPAKEELSGMTPGQMISFYNLRQGLKCSKSISTAAKLPEPLSFTHSSYWVYRAQEQEKQAAQEEIHALQIKMDSISVDQDPISCHSQSVRPSQDVSMECDGMSQSSLHSENNDNALEETKEDERPASVENSNFSVDTDAASSDLEESHDVDIHDSDVRDDSSEALGNADLPQPPKRVRIFEGGFKSNEDYTYVRGRGRGKYVCEECGIRCKKPSMLKKHIRTHTDLRPYKCRHCSFAFKTKGNLTKHMKSKAHHKKCTELGIVPVPTTTDDSQIDEEALAKQEQLERKNIQFSDNDDIDDDDDDEIDDECDDSDVIDEDCESDSGMMSASSNNRSLPNGYSMKCNTWENVNDDQFDDSSSKRSNSAQTIVEQEAAHSLLHLSVLGETSQWSNSTGEMVSITPPPRDIETEFHTNVVLSQPSLAISPQHHSPPVSANISGTEVHANVDQASVLWLTPEPLGHRPRSYSADIPFSSHREPPDKLQQKNDITQKVFENLPELGTREQYGRRYSISVASEARRPNRMMHTSQWGNSSFISSGLNKWPEMDSSDQPMDLTVSRANNAKKLRPDYDPMVCGVSSAVLTVQTLDNHHESTDESLSEQFQPKTIPVLSPQILIGCDNGGENGNSDIGLPVTSEEHQPYSTNPPLSRPPVFYLPDIGLAENTLERKEMEMTEGEASPEPPDYAACSPVTPPSQEENAYFYAQEGLTGSQATNSQEEMPPASACHAEFIVPSTSSGMDEGRCVCRICNKVFAKSSQLRLHVNIHYFERPFRCDNCAVSFRTKGHLQKHKRSVSHYNKVNMNMTFGTPTVDNPRPFKCADCKIAFRIHGHLAKHLRSKMHIMKLECLGKLPFGMYAEMERSGVSLNEIDTTDCSNSLESLQSMATRLYEKDPRRMRWHNPEHLPVELESAKPTTSLPSAPNLATNVEQLPSASFSIPVSISIPTPSIISINPQGNSDSEVKREPSDLDTFRTTNFSDNTSPVSPPVQYAVPQNSVSQELPRRLEGEVDSSASLNRSGTCHICGRLFKSAKFLQVHLYSDHSTWNPPAVGDMPSQTSANIISGHSSVVSELACDLCGRHFPNQTSLQQHLLSHAQPRPFVCEICDAGFTSATLLASHLTTHQSVSTTNTACSESGLVQLR